MYTVAQAAEATGTSKSTILRAIKKQSGKRLSAEKDDEGQWQIDPAELHRVYPIVNNDNASSASGDAHHDAVRDAPRTTPDAVRDAGEINVLQVKLEAAETLTQKQDQTIEHLRSDLAEEKRERRETQTKLTALLTDQRENAPAPEATPKKPMNVLAYGGVIAVFGLLVWLMIGQGG